VIYIYDISRLRVNMISGFCSYVDDVCNLLGYYVVIPYRNVVKELPPDAA